jgi:hypothetical protein
VEHEQGVEGDHTDVAGPSRLLLPLQLAQPPDNEVRDALLAFLSHALAELDHAALFEKEEMLEGEPVIEVPQRPR